MSKEAEVQVREKRLEECLTVQKHRGTCVPLIDTYRDLSDKEKAELYEDVCVRHKLRKPKTNPWALDPKTKAEAEPMVEKKVGG
jgi:hypothetical protein